MNETDVRYVDSLASSDALATVRVVSSFFSCFDAFMRESELSFNFSWEHTTFVHFLET